MVILRRARGGGAAAGPAGDRAASPLESRDGGRGPLHPARV